MKRAALIGAAMLLAFPEIGCSVGQGTGHVKGPLVIEDCGGIGITFPDPMKPEDYDMQPQFFAAEQLLDLASSRRRSNRLLIRLQTTGRRREANDILRFDIPNLYDVARCLRGAKNPDGTPDFDVDNCFNNGTEIRVRVGINALVRANLIPNSTCSTKIQLFDRVGTAISTLRTPADGNWESFIVFEKLGRANSEGLQPDFKIELDDPLSARFSLTIEDDTVVTAQIDPSKPVIPHSHIHGKLAGDFDFTMQRGQGAQTFP